MPETPPDDRFYGRRKGKPLRAGRQQLYDALLPRLRIPLEDLVPEEARTRHPDAPAEVTFDPRTLFATNPRALWLEIGFGGGEHLAAQAAANPDVGLLGAEVFIYGIGKLLTAVDEQGLENVRLWPDDIRPLLPHLPDGCLERIFVLFPDPWPKRRHARRRLIQTRTLDVFARLLMPGGELRVASDDPTYVAWTLRHAPTHPAFTWMARRPSDWARPPADWVQTRYEAKALAAGRKPAYMIFRKTG